ncbi:MAG: Coenzyme F420 hydrogenase/dehydrogenase, beta subunit C-terminal domain [Sphingomonadales bacterium]|nr:Coenzyme F420 hydrogenase/dehydrogenase, beta subunit C-terminal domain [Sphingomonadales bacterium]
MQWDATGFLKPNRPAEWYSRRSERFARQCPFSPAAADEDQIARERFGGAEFGNEKVGRFEAAYVGHVAEGEYRATGSSGGLVSWVAAELLRQGLVDAVAHVAPAADGRLFEYRLSRSVAQVAQGAKSRYYPVELSAVLREIRATPGRYAIVGVPCFIKAIHLLRSLDPLIQERVTHTLGLFCGHMKSAHFVESFAWQLGTELERVTAVDYRVKDPTRPANWYRTTLALNDGSSVAQDWWHLADGDWGAGFFQNSACNACDDVVAETADIAFGDAWVEPYSSDGRGTNVVVVRSREMHELVEEAIAAGKLALQPVDAAFVEQTQAAGLRQRREGLAYRLTWGRCGVRLRKRVLPSRAGIPLRRRFVYRSRAAISAWSLRIFALARRVQWPNLYIGWGRSALRLYQGLTYSRGRSGALFDRIERLVHPAE